MYKNFFMQERMLHYGLITTEKKEQIVASLHSA